jgi:homoserine O-acetyltransferase
VRLTQAMNDYDIARGRGDYLEVIQSIRQRALVVSIRSDLLYPPHEQRLLADHLPNATYAILDSAEGHDGFLIESAELGDLVAAFRNEAGMQPGSKPGSKPGTGSKRRPLLTAVAE